MSATIGIREARTIWPSAAVLSTSGHETRMMSAPASSQRRIWSIVAVASEVGVLVIVCTVIGASPPTGTLPTMICRLDRRRIVRQGRIAFIYYAALLNAVDTLTQSRGEVPPWPQSVTLARNLSPCLRQSEFTA